MNIAQQIFEWLSTVLFGPVSDNVWYTENRDIIVGISIVVICAIVFAMCLWLVIAILRFFGRCLDVKGW